jgi:hypothetical protein
MKDSNLGTKLKVLTFYYEGGPRTQNHDKNIQILTKVQTFSLSTYLYVYQCYYSLQNQPISHKS